MLKMLTDDRYCGRIIGMIDQHQHDLRSSSGRFAAIVARHDVPSSLRRSVRTHDRDDRAIMLRAA